MAITIKKSKLALKVPVAPPAEGQAQPAPEEGDRHDAVEAAPRAATSGGRSVFDIVALVLAVISLVLFLLVITFQALEIQYYNSPPSAFPIGQVLPPVTPTSPAPAPVPAPEQTGKGQDSAAPATPQADQSGAAPAPAAGEAPAAANP